MTDVDRALKIYQGEDRSPITDLTDMAIWETAEFGSRAYLGEAASAQVVIRDEDGRTGNEASLPAGLTRISLAAGNVMELEHGSNILWRGRMASKDYSRGLQRAGRYREANAYLEDVNIDLRGIVVHGWSRPSESDVERLQALIAAYLSGSPRRSTIVNGSNLVATGSNTVNLAAKVYNKTDVESVLAEIAGAANKTYYLLPRNGTSSTSTARMVYDGNEKVIERCPYHITDHEDKVRSSPDHYFFPIFDVGPAATENGQELISGVWLFYGSGDNDFVHVSDPVQANLYIHREVVIYDDTITTAAEATKAASAILTFRKYEERTINVSIGPLTDAHVGSIHAGQTIGIQSKAITFADDVEYDGKIAQCTLTTFAPGRWFAHLQIDRPWRLRAYGNGDKASTGMPHPPTPGSGPTVIRTGHVVGATTLQMELTIKAQDPTSALYVMLTYGSTTPEAIAVKWHTDGLTSSTGESFTLVKSVAGASHADDRTQIWRLLSPSATDADKANGIIVVSSTSMGNEGCATSFIYLSGVNQSDPDGTAVSATGSGTASSVTVTKDNSTDLVLDVVKNDDAETAPTATASQTVILADWRDASPGISDQSFGFGYGSNATPTWSMGASVSWAAVAVPVHGTAGDSPPPAASGTGALGTTTDGCYATCDHVHAVPKLDDLAAPDDNTDLNASTTAHGLLRKLSGSATQFLDGTGVFSTPTASGIQVATGQYTGNGATDRTISLSFTPKLVLIMASGRFFVSSIGATGYGFRIWDTTSGTFNNNSQRPGLTTNGFIVSGTDTTHTNFNGRVNDYLAIG